MVRKLKEGAALTVIGIVLVNLILSITLTYLALWLMHIGWPDVEAFTPSLLRAVCLGTSIAILKFKLDVKLGD